MKQITLILALFISLQITANNKGDQNYSYLNASYIEAEIEVLELEQDIFSNFDVQDTIEVEDIVVYELEEDVEIADQNNSENSLQVSDIKVLELEEDIDLGFDTKMYLPKGFNPYKGMNCEKEIVVVGLR